MRLPEASPVWQQAATLEPQDCWMGMATGVIVRMDYCRRSGWVSRKLTDGDAQAVGANEVLAAVAAGKLLAVAADGAVVLGRDVDLGVAGGLGVGRGSLGGLGLGGAAVAGGGGDEGGHGGDEESLHEGHFVGWWVVLVGWWWWKLVVVGWKRVYWIGCDVLDDEKKLGWRAMRWVVLYLLEESLGAYLVVSCFSPMLVRLVVLVRPFCVIAWSSPLWRCQSSVGPRVSLSGAGGVA